MSGERVCIIFPAAGAGEQRTGPASKDDERTEC
jgi:hypothetical protein